MEEEIRPKKSKLGWSLIPVIGVILVLVILAILYSDINITGLAIFENQKEYSPKQRESYTFKEVYDEIKLIDKIYGTDYHEEKLTENRVQADYLKPMIKDLTKLYDLVADSKETNIKKSILKFIEARRGWLEAQVYFEKALQFGSKGIVTQSFRCADNETVLLATYFYNQTLKKFHIAEFALDDALFYLPEAKELVGVGKNKPKIYESYGGGEIAKTINTNIYVIDKYCRKLSHLQQDEEKVTRIKIT